MSAVTAAALEPVNAFPFEDTILFKHYFDGEAVFDRLGPFYNGSQYRFEVDVAEFDSLRRFLRRRGYDVTVVDRPAEYYVAVRQYTEHPEGLFEQSVHQESADGYNYFLLKDRDAVESAIAQGAVRVTAESIASSTGTLADFAQTSV